MSQMRNKYNGQCAGDTILAGNRYMFDCSLMELFVGLFSWLPGSWRRPCRIGGRHTCSALLNWQHIWRATPQCVWRRHCLVNGIFFQ